MSSLNLFLLDVLGTNEIIVVFFIIGIVILIIASSSKKGDSGNTGTQVISNGGLDPTHQTVVVVNEGKSVGTAFLLAFLFGPLGLLYASVTGGIIMLVISIFVGVVTLGTGLIITWVISIIWAVSAAGNSKSTSTTVVSNNPPAYKTPVTPVPPPFVPASTKESLLNQLSQLHSLMEKGVLTEEIYEKERQMVLDKLSKVSH